MGEYEPDDSRNITQKDGPEPGGLKRTGPREDAQRAEAERREDKKGTREGKRMPEPKQRQRQSQSQSQSQSQGGAEREMNSPQPDGSPLAGIQPQATVSPAGASEPE